MAEAVVAVSCHTCAVGLTLVVEAVVPTRAAIVEFFQEHEACRTHIDLAGAGPFVARALFAS